jgi:APA family basic amino acid/polyamine antiporter
MSNGGLFATKPIADYQAEASASHLVRTLGIPGMIALGIGGIIGSGIFVLTGPAAAQHAGPAIAISFVISGIGCMFAGLCYSELAGLVPVCGSAYAYSYATLGEVVAWFVGWNLILEYMMACAAVAVGWSRYLVALLNVFRIHLPESITSAPFAASAVGVDIHRTGAIINVPAIVIIGLLTALCYKGIKEATFVNTLIVILKVSIVLLVIGFGAFYVNPHNWLPYIPRNTGTFGEFGWSGIWQASAVTFFAYVGFDGIFAAVQEAKNPARDVSAGMLGSLAICALLYILMSSVMTGLVPFPDLNTAAPVVAALDPHPQLAWLKFWVIVGALAGLTTSIITMIIPQARIWLTMSQDGLVPKFFGAVHPRFRTPHISTAITGVLAATFAGLLPIGILGELVSIGTLVAFIVVCIAVVVLRYTRPDLPRPFKVPAVGLIALGGVAFCGMMAYSLPDATWWRLLIWSMIGFALYFGYGHRNSCLRNKQP